MTYRELLERYKRDELEAEQKHQVEADIEKQEAIGDYLYEKEDIPAITELFNAKDYAGDDSPIDSQQQREFMRVVRYSIRKAFIKMGIITSAIAFFILLLIQFVLPEVVSVFYYDPGKEIAKNTNQLSLDIAVYTELLIPQYIRYYTNVEDLGYGNYDISINQNYSYNGVFTNVTGRIEQGRIILYDSNALKQPAANAFAHSVAYDNSPHTLSELEVTNQVSLPASGYSTDNISKLNALSDDNKYVAYLTLERLMDYPSFISFIQDQSIIDAWCAVCTNWNSTTSTMLNPENIGFQYGQFSSNLHWDKERYPDLQLYDEDLMQEDPEHYYEDMGQKRSSEEFMLRHFTSMLRYMSNQKQFLKMMDLDPSMFTNAADFVEENGLLIYGFAIVADKEQLLKLTEEDEIYVIYTQPLR